MVKNNKFTVETFGSYKHLQGELDSIQVNFIDSNRTEAQNKAIYKKHTHIYYEMIVAEKGVYQSAVNDTMLKMNEGDVLRVRRRKHASFTNGSEAQTRHCVSGTGSI